MTLTHPGLDAAARRTAGGHVRPLNDFVKDEAAWLERPRDIQVVLDRMETDDVLRRALNMTRVAVAGHSFGAHTALALLGMRIVSQDGSVHAFDDPRVQAALALSPPSAGRLGLREDAWRDVGRPFLALAGSCDHEPGGGAVARRRMCFDGSHGAHQYFAWLTDVSHGDFDDAPQMQLRTRQRHPGGQRWIQGLSTIFLKFALLGERRAGQLLSRNSVSAFSGVGVSFTARGDTGGS